MSDALLWAIVLLLVGLGLIALELFTPSGGVLGILAALAILGSLAVGFSNGWVTGVSLLLATLVILPVVLALAIHYWPRTPIGRLILLDTPRGDDEMLPETAASRQLRDLIGRRGVAKTKMLPSGAVLIDGRVYDALSEGMAVDPGQAIRVTAIRTNRLVVVLDTDPMNGDLVDGAALTAPAENADPLSKPAEDLGLGSWEPNDLGAS